MNADDRQISQAIRGLVQDFHRRRLRGFARSILRPVLLVAAGLCALGAVARAGWYPGSNALGLAAPALWTIILIAVAGALLAGAYQLRKTSFADLCIPTSARLSDNLLGADALLLTAWEIARRPQRPTGTAAVLLEQARQRLPDWQARESERFAAPTRARLSGPLMALLGASVLLGMSEPEATSDGSTTSTGSAADSSASASISAAPGALEQLHKAMAQAATEIPETTNANDPAPSAQQTPRSPEANTEASAQAPSARQIPDLHPALASALSAPANAGEPERPAQTQADSSGPPRMTLAKLASDGAGIEPAGSRRADTRPAPALGRSPRGESDAAPVVLSRHLSPVAGSASANADESSASTSISPMPSGPGPLADDTELPTIPRPNSESRAQVELDPRQRALLSAYHARLTMGVETD